MTSARALGFLPFDLTVEKLEHTHWGKSSVVDWLYAFAALVLTWIALRALHAIVQARFRATAARTATQLDDVLHEMVAGTSWYFHAALALLVAQRFADFGPSKPYLQYLVVLALFCQLGVWAQRGVVKTTRLWAEKNEGAQNATMAAGIRFVARIGIWMVVALLVLANWGVQVSAMVAGLGVGGIAAALAVQGVLGDVFSGLSMYFDRPFDIGDSIAIPPLRGTVSKIGLRTTRIRSLDGEEIVVPNADMVKSRILNYARLHERRVLFGFGLEYGLSAERIEQARDTVFSLLRAEALVRVDRGHFRGFGPSSLDFEFVYYVLSGEYAVYMDVQQRINLALVRAFSEQGFSFAYPTQTLHHVQQDAHEAPAPRGPGAG